jgi:hypothetical protein
MPTLGYMKDLESFVRSFAEESDTLVTLHFLCAADASKHFGVIAGAASRKFSTRIGQSGGFRVTLTRDLLGDKLGFHQVRARASEMQIFLGALARHLREFNLKLHVMNKEAGEKLWLGKRHCTYQRLRRAVGQNNFE